MFVDEDCKKSVDLEPIFHIFKNADFTLFSGFPENRLTDFLAYYILCFETTYYLSRINTVVVLYLWGIETLLQYISSRSYHFSLSCCTVPMRNWNSSHSFFSSPSLIKLYCTYEELKHDLATIGFTSSNAVVLYLWGIETGNLTPIAEKAS